MSLGLECSPIGIAAEIEIAIERTKHPRPVRISICADSGEHGTRTENDVRQNEFA